MAPGADLGEPLHQRAEGVLEGRPVLEVEPLAQPLAQPPRPSRPTRPRRPPRSRPRGDASPGRAARAASSRPAGDPSRPCMLLADPAPLVVVEHRAPLLGEHAPGARVDHDQARAGRGRGSSSSGCRRVVRSARKANSRSAGSASSALVHPLPAAGPRPARAARGCRRAGRPSRRPAPPTIALVPPGLGAALLDPGPRGVPVVVDVVVVEDHRRGDGGEQPADHRVAPGLVVEARVLLEVGDLVAGRLVGPRRERMNARGLGRDLVGVDLVAEHEQRPAASRPDRGGACERPAPRARRARARAGPGPCAGCRAVRAGSATRQDPNATSRRRSRSSVRMTLGGNGRRRARGQARSPSRLHLVGDAWRRARAPR